MQICTQQQQNRKPVIIISNAIMALYAFIRPSSSAPQSTCIVAYSYEYPRGAARLPQMLHFYSTRKRRGTLLVQYVYSAANASTVQYEYCTSNRRAPYEYCSRILMRTGLRIKRGMMSSFSPTTSSCFLYCFDMFSCNSRLISTHQHDAIARWRLNPYNLCDQAECLLTSYRVIIH